MNIKEIQDVLKDVQYLDWEFKISYHDIVDELFTPTTSPLYLQVRFLDGTESWSGRKWHVSRHATKSEIVQTTLKAVLTAVEHEAREKFLYKNQAIFGPHLDLESLLNLKHDVRN